MGLVGEGEGEGLLDVSWRTCLPLHVVCISYIVVCLVCLV